jgi:hypothetical protein
VKSGKGWSNKKIGLTISIFFITTLLLLAAANFIVNPFGIYPTRIVQNNNNNFRREKYRLFKVFNVEPDTLIIGSSRAMTMNPDDVMTRIPSCCFNYAVPSATAEDYYAVVSLLMDDFGIPLQRIILAVDYEAFNPAEPLQSEIRYFPAYAKHLVLSKGVTANTVEKLALLISYQQTDETVKVLRRTLLKNTEEPKIKLERDGYTIQVEREKEIADGTFNLERILSKRVRKYPERSLKLSHYRSLDPKRLEYLELFLNFCDENGIIVDAYITPYHPTLWSVLDQQPNRNNLDEFKVELTSRFEAHGVVLHDFSHIESFKGDQSRFYDEIHPMPDTQAKILDSIFMANRNKTMDSDDQVLKGQDDSGES